MASVQCDTICLDAAASLCQHVPFFSPHCSEVATAVALFSAKQRMGGECTSTILTIITTKQKDRGSKLVRRQGDSSV